MALQLNCTEQQMDVLERDFLVSSQENNNYGTDVDKNKEEWEESYERDFKENK